MVRALIVPNLKEYDELVREAVEGTDEGKRKEGEIVVEALLEALLSLEEESVGAVNGSLNGHTAEMKHQLDEKIGSTLAEKVLGTTRPRLLKAIMEC